MNQMSFVPPHPPPMPVSFSGDRGEFFGLVTRGAALELITVGFYRFWLATDIRRHLWSNTHIDGDAAEYTGRGKELLIGFLIALPRIDRAAVGFDEFLGHAVSSKSSRPMSQRRISEVPAPIS